MTALVVRGDARCLPLPDRSVDLIVTSPPYWAQRSYTDGGEHYEGQIGDEATPAEYVEALVGCTREWLRVLKPSGSLFVNLGDKYATRYSSQRSQGGQGIRTENRRRRMGPNRSGIPDKSLVGLPFRYVLRCVDELGLIWRQNGVWDKPNALPSSADDRCRVTHEYVLHLVMQGDYFADLDPIREPQSPRPIGTRNATQRHLAATDNTGWKNHAVEAHPLGRPPASVWTIPTQPLKLPPHLAHIGHKAAFPRELPRRLILGWCPPGGVVLDPFGGTGTTALMASLLGRTGITVDRSADYCRIAQWRTAGLLGGAA